MALEINREELTKGVTALLGMMVGDDTPFALMVLEHSEIRTAIHVCSNVSRELLPELLRKVADDIERKAS